MRRIFPTSSLATAATLASTALTSTSDALLSVGVAATIAATLFACTPIPTAIAFTVVAAVTAAAFTATPTVTTAECIANPTRYTTTLSTANYVPSTITPLARVGIPTCRPHTADHASAFTFTATYSALVSDHLALASASLTLINAAAHGSTGSAPRFVAVSSLTSVPTRAPVIPS